MGKQIKAMSTNFNIIEEHLSKSNTDQGDGLAEASTSNMDVEKADDQVTDDKKNEDEEEVSMKSPRKGRKTIIESDGLAEASTSNMDVEKADDQVTDDKDKEQSKKE